MRSWEEIRVGLDAMFAAGWSAVFVKPNHVKVIIDDGLRYQDMPKLAEIFGTEHMNFGVENDDDAFGGWGHFYVEAWA